MNFRIVADSSCDLSDDIKSKIDIGIVPLKIGIDDRTFIDDENLNRQELLREMANFRPGFIRLFIVPASGI